jgi:hypothetical protein
LDTPNCKGQRFWNRVNSQPELDVTVLASNKYPTTMHDPISNVLEFHTTFKCRIGEVQEIPDDPHTLELDQLYNHLMELRRFARTFAKASYRMSRMALNLEELGEKCKAYSDRNLKSLLDAGSDMDYINAGDMIGAGLGDVFYESCERVHKSNMSKTDENGEPIYDEAGKVVKGPNYKPVDLTDLVDGTWLSQKEELAKL